MSEQLIQAANREVTSMRLISYHREGNNPFLHSWITCTFQISCFLSLHPSLLPVFPFPVWHFLPIAFRNLPLVLPPFSLLLFLYYSPLRPPGRLQHRSRPAGFSWTSPPFRWSSRRARRCLRCPSAYASETCCSGTRASRTMTGRQLCGCEEGRQEILISAVRHTFCLFILFFLFGDGPKGKKCNN